MGNETTLIGNDFKVQVGNGASPELFADMCAAFDLAPLGEEKPLVRVTGYCDDAEVYRNGLADGVEVTLQVNFIHTDAQIGDLYADYQANTQRSFRFLVKDVSPEQYFEFAGSIRAWQLQPPIGDRTVIQFTVKISGGVLWFGAP